jgi:hypothetical protein
MESPKQQERRKWPREAVELPAQYFIKNQSQAYKDCKVLSISRNGAAVLFPAYEFVKEKLQVFLDLIVPKTFQQVTVRGQVRIRYRKPGGLVGGIQFDSLLPEHTFRKLI